jgi:hypothetical protein
MNRFGGSPFTWADCKGSEDVTPEDLYLDWCDEQRRQRERRLEAIREQVPADFEDRMAA